MRIATLRSATVNQTVAVPHFGMSNWWKPTNLALIGFMIAIAIHTTFLCLPQTPKWNPVEIGLSVPAVVLCPPSLLTAALIDIEDDTWGGFVLWLIIGLMNAGLYALISLIFADPGKRRSMRV
jgi:hypothetical protein